MPLTRSDKEELIADYEQGLAGSPHAFLLDYKGITVPQVTALREKVRQSGGYYRVVKNTLALRAIDGKALDGIKEHFTGPTAVVFGSDPVILAKVLTDFAKDVPAVKFKAAMVDRQAIGAEQIKDIAQLPSREELIAKLLYLLQSPVTRFVRVLAALPQQFVAVLDQIRVKREEQAPPAAEETPAAAAAEGTPEPAPPAEG